VIAWLQALGAFLLGLLRALDARAGRAEDQAVLAQASVLAEREAREKERAADEETRDPVSDGDLDERLRDGRF
jgi:hypothetical protein